MVELLGKIVYVCNVLLFEKLFAGISGEYFIRRILRAFILASWIKWFSEGFH